MDKLIFGHTWDDIQRAQQRGSLSTPVDVSKPSGPRAPTDQDRLLLEQHGSLEALETAGFYGTADRLRGALS